MLQILLDNSPWLLPFWLGWLGARRYGMYPRMLSLVVLAVGMALMSAEVLLLPHRWLHGWDPAWAILLVCFLPALLFFLSSFLWIGAVEGYILVLDNNQTTHRRMLCIANHPQIKCISPYLQAHMRYQQGDHLHRVEVRALLVLTDEQCLQLAQKSSDPTEYVYQRFQAFLESNVLPQLWQDGAGGTMAWRPSTFLYDFEGMFRLRDIEVILRANYLNDENAYISPQLVAYH